MSTEQKLRGALQALLSIAPKGNCATLHHKKEHRHAFNEPCPANLEYESAISKAKQALAAEPECNNCLEFKHDLPTAIEDMSVHVDVSKWSRFGPSVFDTVTEGMESEGETHGLTFLVQDAEPNFTSRSAESDNGAPVAKLTQWLDENENVCRNLKMLKPEWLGEAFAYEKKPTTLARLTDEEIWAVYADDENQLGVSIFDKQLLIDFVNLIQNAMIKRNGGV
jgi:hypothetical protein